MKPFLFRRLAPYIILILGVSYGIWPVDIIPDFPFIGWIDDLGILGTAITVAYKIYLKNKNLMN